MKNKVISVDKLHELQFDKDYTEYIRGWNEAIDQVLVDGHTEETQDRWHSVAKEGNPKEEGLYIITKKLRDRNEVEKYEAAVDRWSRDGLGKEWSYNSNVFVIAWRPFPKPFERG